MEMKKTKSDVRVSGASGCFHDQILKTKSNAGWLCVLSSWIKTNRGVFSGIRIGGVSSAPGFVLFMVLTHVIGWNFFEDIFVLETRTTTEEFKSPAFSPEMISSNFFPDLLWLKGVLFVVETDVCSYIFIRFLCVNQNIDTSSPTDRPRLQTFSSSIGDSDSPERWLQEAGAAAPLCSDWCVWQRRCQTRPQEEGRSTFRRK